MGCSNYRGLPKKKEPPSKMAYLVYNDHKENVNKSCVFVLHRYLCLRTTLIAILT